MDPNYPVVVPDSLGHFLCNEGDHHCPDDLDQEFQGSIASKAEHDQPRAKHDAINGKQHFADVPKGVVAEISDGGVGDTQFLLLDRALEAALYGHGKEVEGSGKDGNAKDQHRSTCDGNVIDDEVAQSEQDGEEVDLGGEHGDTTPNVHNATDRQRSDGLAIGNAKGLQHRQLTMA
jgi:hypothetical protein